MCLTACAMCIVYGGSHEQIVKVYLVLLHGGSRFVIELVNKQGSSILSVWVPLLNKRYGSHGTNNSTWCTFCWSFPKHQFPSQTIMGPLCINFFSISFQQKDEGVCQIIQKSCRLFRELLFSMGTQSISQSI